MNSFCVAALFCLLLAAVVGAQRPSSTSVCARPDKQADEAILTICTNERGMAPLPQPRLYLRVFADGTAEYERNPRVAEGDSLGYQLERKAVRLTEGELNEIICLGREPDLQDAEAKYEAIYRGIDSSRETTVIFRDEGKKEKIVLNNYWPGREDNFEHYPSSLNALMDRAQAIWERANGIVRDVPTITFCELMLNRSKYLGRRVTIYADLEHHVSVTRDGKRRSIDEFLHDPECDRPELGKAQTTEKIGIAYPDDATATAALKTQIAKLNGAPFHSRARVLVTGTLRINNAEPPFRYPYQFEIGDFKSIEPIILPYQGKLVNGWTYSDTFDHIGEAEIKLSSLLKPELHHAARIEWKNAHAFPSLTKSGRKHITFRVIYMTTHMIEPNRWNDVYMCEILELR